MTQKNPTILSKLCSVYVRNQGVVVLLEMFFVAWHMVEHISSRCSLRDKAQYNNVHIII